MAKVTVSKILRTPSHFEGEFRNCGKYGHKAADCWHKQPKPQGKGKGQAKSNVSEVSESENGRHVEETWTPVSSPQPSSSSQVNTIRTVGCADEGLWIFSLDDSAKRRKTVSWHGSGPEFCEPADSVDDQFWMLWARLSTVFPTAVPSGECFKGRSGGSKRRGAATLRS